MTFNFSVPTPSGPLDFQVEPGASLLFVGANGGGKTRLAVKIEIDLQHKAHRISAHRALNLNPLVPKISEQDALRGLTIGSPQKGWTINDRVNGRWGQKAAISLLNDYDFLLQVLFAEQSNTALTTHKNARAGNAQPALLTKFEKLVEIWDRILPHRRLNVTGDDIRVSATS